ncbi:alkaline phosphatase family protein [Nocardia sp. NBC_00565]|uniref:alkaline phosphatase family protein n=1 Tax=Nocardia sp. NBC_00565 TaxID=2975993 RepID=UPI002E822095|nr:alkaline phosphatase family protein [Nocardia sp. NBC_00565]WUC05984.1 alkaline phosphatase family protein [Nocardia sp. NBC_00565]
MFITPHYGTGSLADLFPSLLAGLGVPGEVDRLGLEHGADRICVLLIDGLGADALAANSAVAPFLSSLPQRALTAGFPSTTTVSLSSLGVGVPPGEHGIVGYLMHVPGYDRLVNPLTWRLHGAGPKIDLLRDLVPEQFQPASTVFERAAADGIAVAQVAPHLQAGSGLTRAVLRGCEFRPYVSFGDFIDGVATALRTGPRSLVYAYHGNLDTTGHVRGPSSYAWLLELAHVDRLAATIAEHLPPDAALIVTADHGMVELADRVDYDKTDTLQDGVHRLGGEPRARHVYTVDGATADVAATWREYLGADFDVVPRAEVIERGWFGPTVAPHVASRIGDLVVAARGLRGVVRTGAEPLESMLIGHHGSLTSAEINVPLATFRP